MEYATAVALAHVKVTVDLYMLSYQEHVLKVEMVVAHHGSLLLSGLCIHNRPLQ